MFKKKKSKYLLLFILKKKYSIKNRQNLSFYKTTIRKCHRLDIDIA